MIVYCIIYLWYDVESCIVILFQICIMKWYSCKIRNDIVCINWYMVRYMIKHHIIIPFLFISYDNIVSNRNTISYQMIHCPIIWYNILSYVTLLYYIIIQYCKVLFDMKLYILHDTILYPMIWYDIVSYHTIRYFNIEHLVWFSYVIGKW